MWSTVGCINKNDIIIINNITTTTSNNNDNYKMYFTDPRTPYNISLNKHIIIKVKVHLLKSEKKISDLKSLICIRIDR